MKFSTFLFCISLYFATPSFAQKEAAIWYFGVNAGLDFNSGSPVALTNGKLSTAEGCASIADKNGNLLFLFFYQNVTCVVGEPTWSLDNKIRIKHSDQV